MIKLLLILGCISLNTHNVLAVNLISVNTVRVVNGATKNDKPVFQEYLKVKPNTTYSWAVDISDWKDKNSKTPNLNFTINSNTVSTLKIEDLTSVSSFNAWWFSSNNSFADLQIIDTESVKGGNDFLMSNMLFQEVDVNCNTSTSHPTPAPEPSSILMASIGLLGLLGLLRVKSFRFRV